MIVQQLQSRMLSELSSGDSEFGFDDPWVITAFVLLGFLLLLVSIRAWNKYCCEINVNTKALKQKVGIAMNRV